MDPLAEFGTAAVEPAGVDADSVSVVAKQWLSDG